MSESNPYPDEERVFFYDPSIEALIPSRYRVEYVTHCRSNFYLGDQSPDHEWVRNDEPRKYCQHRYAIEVTNTKGRVVAAVGWDAYPKRRRVRTIATYVDRKLKRRGLGKALWRAMIRIIRARGYTSVRGCAATDEGYLLLQSMKREFPDVVSFSDDRSFC